MQRGGCRWMRERDGHWWMLPDLISFSLLSIAVRWVKRTYRNMSKKCTLFPAVTLSVPPPCASSIDVIGSPRSSAAVCESVRISHHLDVSTVEILNGMPDSPDLPVFGRTDTASPALPFIPDQAPHVALARQPVRRFAKHQWLSFRSTKIEQADLLLVTALSLVHFAAIEWSQDAHSQEVLRLLLRVQRNRAYNVIMSERMQGLASSCIPNFASRSAIFLGLVRDSCKTHAEKSALPVAAFEVSRESLVDHTAPLCP